MRLDEEIDIEKSEWRALCKVSFDTPPPLHLNSGSSIQIQHPLPRYSERKPRTRRGDSTSRRKSIMRYHQWHFFSTPPQTDSCLQYIHIYTYISFNTYHTLGCPLPHPKSLIVSITSFCRCAAILSNPSTLMTKVPRPPVNARN